MQTFPPTIVLRHQKENLKKCSLRGLESRSDFQFFTYPHAVLPTLKNYLILKVDAPPLTQDDASFGLFIIDSTWRYAERMLKFVEQKLPLESRSIPSHFRTAYPRYQTDCPDPERGLASIEAIYIAYYLMGRETTGLLSDYYWKDPFIQLNRDYLS